jgi:hypothetical protein
MDGKLVLQMELRSAVGSLKAEEAAVLAFCGLDW